MKFPKDDHNYIWTFHVKGKLVQYGIGPNLVKRIIRYPERKEEGIAEKTLAVMRTKGKKKKQEVWVMYQNTKNKKKIISTWIYPGESPKGKEIYVPDEVWEELNKIDN